MTLDTPAAVLAQLAAGEDSLTEFKEVEVRGRSVSASRPHDLAEELVAFANADGGTVVLGAGDEGALLGVPREALDLVEQWVINTATDNCDPPIRPVIRKMCLAEEGAREVALLLVQVGRGVYVHRTTRGRWLVRVGSTKRDLTSAELGRLLQERGRAFVFDEQPVMTATLDDLDRDALERHYGRIAIPWEELLRNTRVAVPGEGEPDHATVAGLLSFGSKPHEHLPSARIDAAVYRGDRLHSADLVHSQNITGTVDRQIDEAVSFVDRFMLRPATKDIGRQDHPQYPIGAVHEAVVNAVAHRDYAIAGSRIRLFLFADRLELHSPGGLPNTLTLETMSYRVFTRNQLLVSFLSRMSSRHTGRAYLESRGEGIRRILEDCERHCGKRPEYRLLGEELLLTIWAKPSPHVGEEPR